MSASVKRLIYQHDAIVQRQRRQAGSRQQQQQINPPKCNPKETDSFEIVTNNIENKMQQLTTEKREVQLMFIKHNHF